MGTPDNSKLSEIAHVVKSWIPWRPGPSNMSRDFWMPDQSCRVCYECDSNFTIFNRRHHCRLCGKVFCAKCTTNSVPAPSDEPRSALEEGDRIRVCNYCFKQWKQGPVAGDNTGVASSPAVSTSPSSSSVCTSQSAQMNMNSTLHDEVTSSVNQDDDTFGDQGESCSRSDEDDDDYPLYQSHSEVSPLSPSDICYDTVNYDQIDHIYEPCIVQPNEEIKHPTFDSSLLPENFEALRLECMTKDE